MGKSRVIESNDIDFYKDKFPFKLKNSGGLRSSSLTLDRNPILTKEANPKPRKSKITRTVKNFGDDF